nr:DNA-3-methyladenine glycosylase I [Alloscardovia sp. HMSC034E08]
MSYCGWESAFELGRAYRDSEWGIQVRDDHKQFEFLMMEVMQCGSRGN